MFPYQRQPIVSTMPTDQFPVTNLETYVLKVHVNCDGCRQKVKKILRKIEGVYTVSIDAEQDRVTVRGIVNSATLIKKLAKSGKPAQLFYSNSNQRQLKQEEDPSNLSRKVDYNKKRRNLMRHYLNNDGSITTAPRNHFIFPGLYDTGVEREWSIKGNGEKDNEEDEEDDFVLDHHDESYNDEGSIEDGSFIPMMDMERNHGYQDGDGYGGHQFHSLRDFSHRYPGYVYHQQQHPSQSMIANMMGNHKFPHQKNNHGYAEWMKATDPRNLRSINNMMIADQYQAPITPQYIF